MITARGWFSKERESPTAIREPMVAPHRNDRSRQFGSYTAGCPTADFPTHHLNNSSVWLGFGEEDGTDPATSLLLTFARVAGSLRGGEEATLRLLPMVAVLLTDSSQRVRRAALDLLAAWCASHPSVCRRAGEDVDVVASVTGALENDDEAVCAVLALVEGGATRALGPAAPVLAAIVRDDSSTKSLETRRDAALALAQLALVTEVPVDVLPALIEAMRWTRGDERSRGLRVAAAEALRATLRSSADARHAAKPLVPELVALLGLPHPADICECLEILAEDGAVTTGCVATLATLVDTHTPRGVQPVGETIYADRDAVAAAAARALSALCPAARDALHKCDGARPLVEAVRERARLLEEQGRPRTRLADGALDASLLALAAAASDHEANAARSVACGALAATLAALPFSPAPALRVLSVLVRNRHVAAFRDLRPAELLESLQPRLANDPVNADRLAALLALVDPPRPQPARVVYPHAPLRGASPRPSGSILTPRPSTADKYSPYRRTSLW